MSLLFPSPLVCKFEISLWPHLFLLPISAADGEYVSDALLVPDRCRFLHQEQMDTCKSYVYWHNIAKQVRSVICMFFFPHRLSGI